MKTFLPAIHGSGPVAQATDKARQLYELMRDDPRQQRAQVLWHDTIAQVAQDKVQRQAHEGWHGHVDPQGRGPNHFLRLAGYRLPAIYATELNANNVESILYGGGGKVQETWASLMQSPSHSAHLLGLADFYREQIYVGVGYCELQGSRWRHYWAILAAHAEAQSQPALFEVTA